MQKTKMKMMGQALDMETRRQPLLTSWISAAYANGLREKKTSYVNNAMQVRMFSAWKTPLHRLVIGIAQHAFSELMGLLQRTMKSGCKLISCAT